MKNSNPSLPNGWEALMTFLESAEYHENPAELDSFLEANPVCKEAWETMAKGEHVLQELSEPEPSDRMQVKFDDMLANWQEEEEPKSVARPLWERYSQGWMGRVAAVVLIFAMGIGTGFWVNQKNDSQLDELQSEVSKLNQMMMLTLMEQPSASERLRAVSISNQMTSVDGTVLEALFLALNTDPNTNVRLASVEALVNWSDLPEVRVRLIRSMVNQESPLVQLALADAMVLLKEKKSVEAFEEILTSKNLEPSLREQLKSRAEMLY